MSTWPLLSILTFLPLAGAIFVLLIPGNSRFVARNAYAIGLWTSFIVFLLSLFVLFQFSPTEPGFQFVESRKWVDGVITYRMGVDGISLPLILLTTALVFVCLLASRRSITVRVKEYVVLFLVMETLMVGVFCALDLFLFYLFFEGGLIPMFLIIGIWGGTRRVYASFKFFLYTLVGSLLMLVAILFIYWKVGTTDIVELLKAPFAPQVQIGLWLAFFASFAVKMPMWPLHTWLPDAHVEAPTAGSMVLAGVLLKMGGYGFLRFLLPMFPDATEFFTPMVFTLSVVAILYASLVALAQEDMKKLIAYTSVAHMGFVTMGLVSNTAQGIEGAMFLMMSHGWVSAGLFFCVGVLYDRVKTRNISSFGGLAARLPVFAVAFMVLILANTGVPGTSGFVGEFLTIMGTWKISAVTALLATVGIILSACYSLPFYRRIMYGEAKEASLRITDSLGAREIFILALPVVATLFFGIAPMALMQVSQGALQGLIMP